MIKIHYYSEVDDSTKKILQFLKKRRIPVEKLKIQTMTKGELIHILSLSENGFDSIIKRIQNEEVRQKIKDLTLSTHQLIDFLLENRQLIKTPILVDKRRLQVGYHIDEIRQFIPKTQRILQLSNLHQREELAYGMG